MEMPIVKREDIAELMRLLSCKPGTMEDRLAISELEELEKLVKPEALGKVRSLVRKL